MVIPKGNPTLGNRLLFKQGPLKKAHEFKKRSYGVSKNWDPLFRGTHNNDERFLGLCKEPLCFGTIPYDGCRTARATQRSKRSNIGGAGVPALTVFWVAVKELNLSYYIGETLLFTIYTHYGNLT